MDEIDESSNSDELDLVKQQVADRDALIESMKEKTKCKS